MKKKTKVLALCSLCAAMGLGIVATAGATMGFDGIGIMAAKHDASHVLTEKAYEAPGVDKEGYKPYWHCAECCTVDANSARYDFVDKDTQVKLEQIVMAPLTGATEADIVEGDEIGTINKGKFKYVDQGVNGVDGEQGTSNPLYIKDSGKTALFFSRSGKTGEAYNATDNTNCSEFRFSPMGKAVVSSVTFSYRYLDYGKGVWNGGSGVSEPAGWHSMVQFKDGTYYGKAVEFQNDDTWHEMTLTYKDWESAGSKDATTNFTDLIFKFVDLRGHFMISGLKFNTATMLTLKNTTADGTDVTKAVTDDKLPEAPAMEGKKFLGWYDEAGNEVTSAAETTTLVAKWAVEYRSFGNDVLLDLDKGDEFFGEVEGYQKLKVRGIYDKNDDVANNRYVLRDNSVVLFPWVTNWYTGKVGAELPAFNFSEVSGKVFFNFGLHLAMDNTSLFLEGTDLGQTASDIDNYLVTVDGKVLTVVNVKTSQTFDLTLADEVYNGERGLQLTCDGFPYRFLVISAFYAMDCDYVAVAKKYEEALPETPVTDDTAIASVKEIQKMRNWFSAYEVAQNPMSAKLEAWINALPKTLYSFDDHGISLTAKGISNSQGAVDAAYREGGIGSSVPFNLGDGYFIATTNNLTKSVGCVTLPALDFSAYKKVTFAFGFGGNAGNGSKSADWALGQAPEGATSVKDLDTFIGASIPTLTNAWGLAEDMKAVISGGNIVFNNSGSVKDKTFALDNDIYTGKKGLTLSLSDVCWEFMVISPIIGSNL